MNSIKIIYYFQYELFQETLVDLMKTEQRIKAEKINLMSEKKQVERYFW